MKLFKFSTVDFDVGATANYDIVGEETKNKVERSLVLKLYNNDSCILYSIDLSGL